MAEQNALSLHTYVEAMRKYKDDIKREVLSENEQLRAEIKNQRMSHFQVNTPYTMRKI
ncbi:MAG: hypothetical protein QHH06_03940 [Clostridiales bacterium]|jgi:hypothetical protein|nr:hypothetical protein [Eubacteriales bacterium]MDH7565618.1 hypothetical protein [Clostridiales bacterium]